MKEEHKECRTKLLRTLEAPAAVILFSGNPPMRSADKEYPFSVDRSFYYYTGLEERGTVIEIEALKIAKA